MKGRKDHEKKHEGEHHKGRHHRARGGEMKIDGEPEIGGHPVKESEKPAQSGRKHGGKVHGKHPGHRLDKRRRGGHVEHKEHHMERARGGRMTPKDPLSGADAPDLGYAKGNLSAGSEGEGKDKK